MPAVATGAGMAAAGGMSIKGSLDTSLIERGFMRVKQGFESVKGQVKGFTADLSRMSEVTKGLASGMTIMAATGTTAMLALASKAPAVAPALAKIGVQMDKLSRTLGRTLQPEFERFAEYFERFVSFADAHPNILKGFVLSAGAIAGIRALSFLFGIKITPGMLGALGYISAIGVTGYAGAKGAEAMMDKANEWLGLNQTPVSEVQMTAGGYAGLLQDKLTGAISGRPSRADIIHEKDLITEQGFRPTPGGAITAGQEEDRRFSLLNWWDAVWS